MTLTIFLLAAALLKVGNGQDLDELFRADTSSRDQQAVRYVEPVLGDVLQETASDEATFGRVDFYQPPTPMVPCECKAD